MMNVILIEGKSGGEEEEVAGSTAKLKLSISRLAYLTHLYLSPLWLIWANRLGLLSSIFHTTMCVD